MSFQPTNEGIIKFIDAIKVKIDSNAPSQSIEKELTQLFTIISKLYPFNNYLFDIYTETKEIENYGSKLLDPNKKAVILMKLDFWKTKLNNSIDTVEL